MTLFIKDGEGRTVTVLKGTVVKPEDEYWREGVLTVSALEGNTLKFVWTVDVRKKFVSLAGSAKDYPDGDFIFTISSPLVWSDAVGLCGVPWRLSVKGFFKRLVRVGFAAWPQDADYLGVQFSATMRFESSEVTLASMQSSVLYPVPKGQILREFENFDDLPPASWTASAMIVELTAVFPDRKFTLPNILSSPEKNKKVALDPLSEDYKLLSEDFMKLTTGNILERYEVAKKLGASKLVEKVAEFMVKNWFELDINGQAEGIKKNEELMKLLRGKNGK